MMKHIPAGQDFSASDFPREFGFHGSAGGAPGPTGPKTAAPPYAGDKDTHGSKSRPEPEEAGEQAPGDFARGGGVGGHPHGDCPIGAPMPHASGGHIVEHHHGGHSIHHADGHMTHHNHDGSPAQAMAQGGGASHMHPHGHHVTDVEHRSDGKIVHHHSHGGHSVHHADGRITHHDASGAPVMAQGGGMGQQDGTYVNGGAAEHHERHGGGMAHGGRARLPRAMTPVSERRRSPIETPPRNPGISTSPRNNMPGGQMPYGVEPSAEPDQAGSTQGIPQMKHGGKAKANDHDKDD